jgi:hypothetical protein
VRLEQGPCVPVSLVQLFLCLVEEIKKIVKDFDLLWIEIHVNLLQSI